MSIRGSEDAAGGVMGTVTTKVDVFLLRYSTYSDLFRLSRRVKYTIYYILYCQNNINI